MSPGSVRSAVIIFLSLTLVLPCSLFSQGRNIGFGTQSPHPSAIVHLGDDQSKGFKIPYTDTNAVIAYANSFTPPMPIANGLLIFQKGAETFFYYDAPKNMWIPLSGIIGPTGPKGPTGAQGATGPRGFGSEIRHGNGFPTYKPTDTCGTYYLDMSAARMYKFFCPGGWGYLGGSYNSKIIKGETAHVSSLLLDSAIEGSSGTTIMNTINNLVYTVTAPIGYTAMAFIRAYGSVKKTQVNDEYNWAKFDIYLGTPPIAMNKWQVVTMGPSGPSPHFHQDLVKWSISVAADLGSGKRIEIRGGQKVGTKTGLGSVIVSGPPGSDTQAHMEIMVYYVRN